MLHFCIFFFTLNLEIGPYHLCELIFGLYLIILYLYKILDFISNRSASTESSGFISITLMRWTKEYLTFLLDVRTDCVIVRSDLWVGQLVIRLVLLLADIYCVGDLFSELCFDISKRFWKMDRCTVFVHSMRDLLCNSLTLCLRRFSR